MAKKRRNQAPLVPLLQLRQWLDYRGLSDDDMAERMGVSRETVWRWKTGGRGIKEPKRRAIAKILDIEPDELYRSPGRPSIDAMLKNQPQSIQEMAVDMVKLLIDKNR